MITLPERIKTIITEQGLSKSAFAQEIGVTPSAITHILKGTTGISSQTAKIIEMKYGYSAEWVLTGEGDKKTAYKDVPENRRDLFDAIDALSDEEIEVLAMFIDKLKGIKE